MRKFFKDITHLSPISAYTLAINSSLEILFMCLFFARLPKIKIPINIAQFLFSFDTGLNDKINTSEKILHFTHAILNAIVFVCLVNIENEGDESYRPHYQIAHAIYLLLLKSSLALSHDFRRDAAQLRN